MLALEQFDSEIRDGDIIPRDKHEWVHKTLEHILAPLTLSVSEEQHTG